MRPSSRYGIHDGLGQQFFFCEVESKRCVRARAVLANFGGYEYS